MLCTWPDDFRPGGEKKKLITDSPNFGKSTVLIRTLVLSFPPVLKSSGHVQSTIIPQNNSASFIFHILKGVHDWSMLAKDKWGKTSYTNCGTPCSSLA